MLKELRDALREWFNDVCNCNGNNNLYTPQLTCLDTTTGLVTSIVHHDGDMTAQMLINEVVADIYSNDPPLINLPRHGWIVFLNITTNLNNATSNVNNTMYVVSTNRKSSNPEVIIISVTITCVVMVLLILLLVGVIYAVSIHRR